MRSSSCVTPQGSAGEFDTGHISDDSRMLANRLSSHMGIEHAIQVSTENQWHGVVAALMELQQKNTARS
ncbi:MULTISPECIES: hypothetical protein [Kordiimonas]|jgi:hypothetical protein|uniref:Uncharacterized protein n=1 Tax=Kordiimonas lacus TaxID=637679 RepID=A0A1G6XWW6_9PROT|nr:MULTISPECIES: hypothetical protein [Kordiimonas]SDD81917.1 hypothetical protein SAMN04488071_1377 [Kordiimonas lacus]